MATTTEKIKVGIDNEVVELEGDALKEFIAQRQIEHNHYLALVAERKSNAAAKTALLDRLGITAEEAHLLLS